ncbi:MAG: hypothetical protein H6713_28720 [Myxococcales bacterium]|nr:hypothetical protein [Myxococcales bacterium]
MSDAGELVMVCARATMRWHSRRIKRRAGIVGVAWVVGLAPARGVTAPAEASAPQVDARAEQAHALFEAGMQLESARVFEDLWSSTRRGEFLYFAALARQAAGDHAHAAALLEQYLRLTTDDEARALARSKLASSASYTTPVRLRVTPKGALTGGRLTLTRRDPQRVDGPFEYPFTVDGGAATLELEPGDWTIELAAEGYERGTRELRVARGQAGALSMAIELVAAPMPVRVVFGPDAAVTRGVNVRVRSGPGVTGPYSERVDGAVFSRRLRQGTWALVFEAPGHKPREHTLEVGPEPVELDVTLETDSPAPATPSPEPTVDSSQRARVALAGGLGGVGGLLLASGIGFAIGGRLRLDDALGREQEVLMAAGLESKDGVLPFGDNAVYEHAVAADAIERAYPRSSYHRDLCAGIGFQDAGAGLIGGGVGFLLGTIAARLDAPSSAWWVGLGVGVAGAATGGVWLATITPKWRSFQEVSSAPYGHLRPTEDIVSEHGDAQAGLASVTGFGAGLIVASVAGLLSRRAREGGRRRALSLQPTLSPASAGLQLRGAF